MPRLKHLFALLASSLLLGACAGSPDRTTQDTPPSKDSGAILVDDSYKKESTIPIDPKTTIPVLPDDEAKFMDEATDAVLDVPDIQRFSEYIKRESKGKNKMKVWCFSTGTDTSGRYALIHVGEDNGHSVVAHYIFYYHPNAKTISYFDPLSDSAFSLAEWRKKEVTW